MKQKLIRTIFWQKRISSFLIYSYIPKVGQVAILDNPRFILYKRGERYSISYDYSHVKSFHSKKISEMVLIELENNWEWKMYGDIKTELQNYINRYLERMEYEI